MPDYSDYNDVIKALGDAQDADKDLRENAREARIFLDKRDGQWEQGIWSRLGREGRPRYTLDKCNPIVNQIAGEIKKADFDIKIRPGSGDASKDTAKVMDGMVRNIESMSNAVHVFNHAAKNMIATGVDGWMVVQDWSETDSFDQDLFIKPIPDFIDSVWFDPNSQEQDRSDAKWAIKLTALSKDAYNEKYPDGTGRSISQDRQFNAYWHKADVVIVGEFYWIEERPKVLIQMSNGAVYSEEEIKPVIDELEENGITEKARRTRPSKVVNVRHLDGGGWLDDEQETVFSWIPIIPTYGNFNIVENKLVFRGAVEKLMDAQRIYNYARSRQIEEGALAPKDKYWMTREQAEGESDTLRTMNTNSDPVQFYNHVDGQPQPYKGGPANVNPSLETTAASANQDITQGSGMFAANMGDNPSLQSGVAIEALQERGDTGTIDYFESQEIAICHTAKIIVDAIPKVYDTERQIRILGEDGAEEILAINQPVIDGETGNVVTLNDLSAGRYDVACDVGKSFKNRQQESVAAILEMAQLDPTLIQEGGDVLLNNTNAPGLDILAERKRAQLLNAGIIPQDQWTDEETAQIQQAQAMAAQNQQPDAAMVLAQAEMMKAQADQMDAQTKQQEAQNRQVELQIKAAEMQSKAQVAQGDQALKAAKLQQEEDKAVIGVAQQRQEFNLKIESMAQELQLAQQKEMREMRQAMIEGQNTMADTLNKLREAMGVDTIVGPGNTKAYINQAEEIVETQEINQ